MQCEVFDGGEICRLIFFSVSCIYCNIGQKNFCTKLKEQYFYCPLSAFTILTFSSKMTIPSLFFLTFSVLPRSAISRAVLPISFFCHPNTSSRIARFSISSASSDSVFGLSSLTSFLFFMTNSLSCFSNFL